MNGTLILSVSVYATKMGNLWRLCRSVLEEQKRGVENESATFPFRVSALHRLFVFERVN